MFKTIKNAFSITNESLILATPLILFMLILSVYLGFAGGFHHNWVSRILFLMVLISMTAAFLAGWLYMTKQAIALFNKKFVVEDDRTRESFGMLKDFPIGVGEFFLQFAGMVILFALLLALMMLGAFLLGKQFLGNPGITMVQLKLALATPEATRIFLNTLTDKQLIILNNWNMLLLGSMSLFYFLTMFWTPEMIYKTKNPIKALWRALICLFKKPLPALGLFLYMTVINFTFSTLNVFGMSNLILYFVLTLLYFYFIVYMVVLVFLYYERTYIED